ncbi:MAG: chemotaxis-specific protein-glutamate methyltransferase CheB [Nitrosomonas sp.]|nr:MAG: chemotaxis-specific protein-glutamate methyltransferase CheB [Nitrosomonas sp.]
MVKILIVEDSDVVSLLLKTIFESEPDMLVIGHAKDGREAVRLAHELSPDLITMDICMPVMDGFEATRLIMLTNPVPIVVISSGVDDEELRVTFRAIEEGALAVLEKPVGLNHPGFESMCKEMIDTIRSMVKVKVERRIGANRLPCQGIFEAAIQQQTKAHEIVAIGCSTGGPQALFSIFSNLPLNFPIPIVVTQHISRGFIGGLVAWLQGGTMVRVVLAENGQPLKPGTIYFAPDNVHLQIARNESGLIACFNNDPEINGFRPSATQLFKSVAEICRNRSVGVLLTGMGSDGADGLLAMRRVGAHTIVQDEESAVVYGMPGSAITLQAVDQVVQLQDMAAYLLCLVRK